MIKYGFRIKTRGGMIVENLLVAAQDQPEAERKIAQIYQRCVILECKEMQQTVKEDGMSFESVISLIGRESTTDTPPKG